MYGRVNSYSKGVVGCKMRDVVCVWLWMYKRKELASGAASFMQRDLQANLEGKAGLWKLLASEEGRNSQGQGRNRAGRGQEEAGLKCTCHIVT